MELLHYRPTVFGAQLYFIFSNHCYLRTLNIFCDERVEIGLPIFYELSDLYIRQIVSIRTSPDSECLSGHA